MSSVLRSLLVFIIAATVVSAQAQESAQELRQQARVLWKKQDAMNKEVKKIQKEVHRLEAKAYQLENADKLDVTISGLDVVTPKKARKILLYSRTKGFRHNSIPYGTYAITEMGKRTKAFSVDATEDPAVFTTENLAQYDAVLMLNTTGNEAIPPGDARKAFEGFLEGDKGLIGIHAATDCHANWKNYREAMGGIFDGHPWGAGSLVTLYNEEPEHPVCKHVPQGYQIKDEIYQYKDDEHFTRDKLRILVSLDLDGENMKKGGMKRKDHDYAVSWVRTYSGSRVFYSNLGHNEFTYFNPVAMQHFMSGIQFALGDLSADARPSAAVGNGTAKGPSAGF